DEGHRVLVKLFHNAIIKSKALLPSTIASTVAPTAPYPSLYQFPGITWTSQPIALTEYGGNTFRRLIADLRRIREVRFEIGVLVAGAATCEIHPEYSLDGGTTWKTFDR